MRVTPPPPPFRLNILLSAVCKRTGPLKYSKQKAYGQMFLNKGVRRSQAGIPFLRSRESGKQRIDVSNAEDPAFEETLWLHCDESGELTCKSFAQIASLFMTKVCGLKDAARTSFAAERQVYV